MANIEDFYEVLGLEPMASADEIRIAYRQKARQVHPDVAGIYAELVLASEAAWRGSDVRLDVPVPVVCSNCQGTGLAEPFVCRICRGRGRWRDNRPVRFFLPPPIRDGQTVTINLQAADIPAARLYLHVRLSWL